MENHKRNDAVDASQRLIRVVAAALFVLVLMVAVIGIGTWQDYRGNKQHAEILERTGITCQSK